MAQWRKCAAPVLTVVALIGCDKKATEQIDPVQSVRNSLPTPTTIQYRQACAGDCAAPFVAVTLAAGEVKILSFPSYMQSTFGTQHEVRKPVELQFSGDVAPNVICQLQAYDESIVYLMDQAVPPLYDVTLPGQCTGTTAYPKPA